MASIGHILIILGAYLIGSVSAAIIVCKSLNLPDPRDSGSNNPGATNVLRIGGKLPALLTLAGDMFKGLLPVATATYLKLPDSVIALVALAAFLGHLFPVFFQFKGGKGVATALGALIGATPITGLLAVATWLATCLVFRISSLAALVTFSAVPLFLLMRGQGALATGFAAIAVLLFYTHRSNIARIRKGEEPRVGKSATR